MGLCGLGLLYSPLWRFNVKSQCGSPEIPSSHEAILSRYRGDRAWGVAGAAIERPQRGERRIGACQKLRYPCFGKHRQLILE